MKRIFFLCALVISFQSLSAEIEKNTEINLQTDKQANKQLNHQTHAQPNAPTHKRNSTPNPPLRPQQPTTMPLGTIL